MQRTNDDSESDDGRGRNAGNRDAPATIFGNLDFGIPDGLFSNLLSDRLTGLFAPVISSASSSILSQAGETFAKASPLSDALKLHSKIADSVVSSQVAQVIETIGPGQYMAGSSVWTGFLKGLDVTGPFQNLMAETVRVQGLGQALAAQNARLAELFSVQLSPLFEWTKNLPQLSDFFNITPEQLEQWRRIGHPCNWDEDLDIDAATELAMTGWPIAWVPRSAIVHALVSAADDDARDQILLQHRDDLFEDCVDALSYVEHPDLSESAAMALNTIAAMKDGHLMPAQAASAVIGDSVCRQIWNLNSRDVQAKSDMDVLELPIRRFIWGLCMVAIAAAFAPFWEDKGDPIPTRYNRHASVHTVSSKQYTDANSICAILSAVSLICQANADLHSEALAPA